MLFQEARQTANYHAICRHVRSLRCLLRCGAAEPLLEMRRRETRFLARGKTLIVQICAEIERISVRDHLSWVSSCAQETSGEFVHSDWFGAGNLDDTV